MSSTPTPPPTNGRSTITRDTGLSVGLLLAVIGGVAYLATWMAKIDMRLASVEDAVQTHIDQVD